MSSTSANGSGYSNNIVVDITETLEACGINRDEYQLYNYIDIDALERVLDSSSEEIKIHFIVEGIPLVVTSGSIDVLTSEVSSRPNS